MIYSVHFKRLFDIFSSLLGIILFGWLVVLIILLFVLSFQFPVFFFQKRIGKNQQPFLLVKFRSLVDLNNSTEKKSFLLGEVLRYLSLDELPQVWNVLRGDMSLIGPRPLPVEYLELMNEDQKKRHKVLPGITGWAQVNGRHSISWQRKFELDSYYVDHVSFKLDVIILLKTIVLLLSFKKDRSLKEEKFQGN